MEQLRHRRTAIAAEIRAELARRNLPLQTLALASDISLATLRLRLKGTRPFTTDELDRITHALRIELSDLIERAEVAS